MLVLGERTLGSTFTGKRRADSDNWQRGPVPSQLASAGVQGVHGQDWLAKAQRLAGNRAVAALLSGDAPFGWVTAQRGRFGVGSSPSSEDLLARVELTPEAITSRLDKYLPREGPARSDAVSSALNLLGDLYSRDRALFMVAVATLSNDQVSHLLEFESPSPGTIYHAAVLEQIRRERIAVTGEASVGKHKWAGSDADESPDEARLLTPRGTDFDRWILNQGPEPTGRSTLNCWEASLFVGYKAGVIPLWFIKHIHTEATASGRASYKSKMKDRGYDPIWDAAKGIEMEAYYPLLEAHQESAFRANQDAYTLTLGRYLGSGTAVRWDGSQIPRGNLVFFNSYTGHTAMSLGFIDSQGEHQILSLWTKPLESPKPDAIQLTTVEKVAKSMARPPTITQTKPPWL